MEDNHSNAQHATLFKWDEQWEIKLQQLIASAVNNAESDNRKIILDQVIHKFQSTTTSEEFFQSLSKLQLITIFIFMTLHFFAMVRIEKNSIYILNSPVVCLLKLLYY